MNFVAFCAKDKNGFPEKIFYQVPTRLYDIVAQVGIGNWIKVAKIFNSNRQSGTRTVHQLRRCFSTMALTTKSATAAPRSLQDTLDPEFAAMLVDSSLYSSGSSASSSPALENGERGSLSLENVDLFDPSRRNSLGDDLNLDLDLVASSQSSDPMHQNLSSPGASSSGDSSLNNLEEDTDNNDTILAQDIDFSALHMVDIQAENALKNKIAGHRGFRAAGSGIADVKRQEDRPTLKAVDFSLPVEVQEKLVLICQAFSFARDEYLEICKLRTRNFAVGYLLNETARQKVEFHDTVNKTLKINLPWNSDSPGGDVTPKGGDLDDTMSQFSGFSELSKASSFLSSNSGAGNLNDPISMAIIGTNSWILDRCDIGVSSVENFATVGQSLNFLNEALETSGSISRAPSGVDENSVASNVRLRVQLPYCDNADDEMNPSSKATSAINRRKRGREENLLDGDPNAASSSAPKKQKNMSNIDNGGSVAVDRHFNSKQSNGGKKNDIFPSVKRRLLYVVKGSFRFVQNKYRAGKSPGRKLLSVIAEYRAFENKDKCVEDFVSRKKKLEEKKQFSTILDEEMEDDMDIEIQGNNEIVNSEDGADPKNTDVEKLILQSFETCEPQCQVCGKLVPDTSGTKVKVVNGYRVCLAKCSSSGTKASSSKKNVKNTASTSTCAEIAASWPKNKEKLESVDRDVYVYYKDHTSNSVPQDLFGDSSQKILPAIKSTETISGGIKAFRKGVYKIGGAEQNPNEQLESSDLSILAPVDLIRNHKKEYKFFGKKKKIAEKAEDITRHITVKNPHLYVKNNSGEVDLTKYVSFALGTIPAFEQFSIDSENSFAADKSGISSQNSKNQRDHWENLPSKMNDYLYKFWQRRKKMFIAGFNAQFPHMEKILRTPNEVKGMMKNDKVLLEKTLISVGFTLQDSLFVNDANATGDPEAALLSLADGVGNEDLLDDSDNVNMVASSDETDGGELVTKRAAKAKAKSTAKAKANSTTSKAKAKAKSTSNTKKESFNDAWWGFSPAKTESADATKTNETKNTNAPKIPKAKAKPTAAAKESVRKNSSKKTDENIIVDPVVEQPATIDSNKKVEEKFPGVSIDKPLTTQVQLSKNTVDNKTNNNPRVVKSRANSNLNIDTTSSVIDKTDENKIVKETKETKKTQIDYNTAEAQPADDQEMLRLSPTSASLLSMLENMPTTISLDSNTNNTGKSPASKNRFRPGGMKKKLSVGSKNTKTAPKAAAQPSSSSQAAPSNLNNPGGNPSSSQQSQPQKSTKPNSQNTNQKMLNAMKKRDGTKLRDFSDEEAEYGSQQKDSDDGDDVDDFFNEEF